MARPKKYRNEEERKQARREAARERRAIIKQDPVLDAINKENEKLRRKRRLKEGKIKLVTNMTDREKRQKRKQWRIYTRNSRLRKAALQNIRTPTSQNSSTPTNNTCSSRPGRRKRARKDRAKAYRNLQKERESNKKLSAKVEKYRKRFYRLQQKQSSLLPLTPKKKAKLLLKSGKRNVQKKLIFGEVLKAELKNTYRSLKSDASRQVFSKIFSGPLLKKYRLMKEAGDFLSYKAYKINNTRRNVRILNYERSLRRDAIEAEKVVSMFLKSDENSWQCPGKKDFVRRNGIKKQKRYLLDTLYNLYKKFTSQNVGMKIGYSTFCRFRPFYIRAPKAIDRETCLCMQHENMRLLLESLKKNNVISFSNPEDLVSALICNESRPSDDCFTRLCNKCKDKEFPKEIFLEHEVPYYQWLRTDQKIQTLKGSEKIIKVVIKKEMQSSLSNLCLKVEKQLDVFLIHIKNIRHQQRIFRELRTSQNNDTLTVHIDFSENYLCKYALEPQAVHFGGSRKQISLHTGVAYCRGEKLSFATASECLRHDAKAVMAHLKPILKHLFNHFESVSQLNFISDGPSSQYKNRTMFTIMGTIIPNFFPTIKKLSWNYSESGHGKGAADGVGGVLKRTADQIVAYKNDIVDVHSFINKLNKITPKVFIKHVSTLDIDEMDQKITVVIPTVKGSNQVHQVTWEREVNNLYFNSLSCLICKIGTKCIHYAKGFVSLPSLSVDPILKTLNLREDQWTDLDTIVSQKPAETTKGNPMTKYRDPEDLQQSNILTLNNHETTLPEELKNELQERPKANKTPNLAQRSDPVFIPDCVDGNWIIVDYEDEWCLGIVEALDGNEIHVNYMAKSKELDNRFYWPLVPDRHKIRRENILYLMPSPPIGVSSRYMAIKDFKYINYLHKLT